MARARTTALAQGKLWVSFNALSKYCSFRDMSYPVQLDELTRTEYLNLVGDVKRSVERGVELPLELMQLFFRRPLGRLASWVRAVRPKKLKKIRTRRNWDDECEEAQLSEQDDRRRARNGLGQYRYDSEYCLVYILDGRTVVTTILPDEGQQRSLDDYCLRCQPEAKR